MKDDTFLGVDYGVRRVAWALLRPGHRPRISVGELSLPGRPKRNKPLCDICQLAELVEYFHGEVVCCLGLGDVVALERPITGVTGNARDAARMGMVAGALMSAALTKSVDHMLLSPASWKKAALGNGNATKSEVMAWARTAYPELELTSQDVADSVAIATAAHLLWTKEASCT